jgi:hypothetical protein
MIEYLIKGSVKRVDNEYILQIGTVNIPIEQDEAEKIVVETLPENQLVWHINTKKGFDIFFNELYPEWSPVPHPSGWVAGNIYYRTKKDAQVQLEFMIQREIDRIAFNAQTQINVLKDSLAVPSSP